MKDVLRLHVNAQPHTSLSTREAIVKMWWTVLPQPAFSPDLAPSNYHLFGPVKYALIERHFGDGNELKGSFRDVLRSRCREFYKNGIQCHNQRWQKCVENEEDFGGNQLHN
jgi:hypothetical protein